MVKKDYNRNYFKLMQNSTKVSYRYNKTHNFEIDLFRLPVLILLCILSRYIEFYALTFLQFS